MAYTVTTALGVFLLQTTVDSLKINYMDKGSGELVVLLHGWGSNIELFENMSELLARKYHVIAPDMPGFGLSDEPKEPWRVDDYVDFVLKFLEPFAPEKVTFLGHSFGGRVIIKMASRKLPFEIEKVILVDSAGVKPKKTAAQKLRQRNYKIGRKNPRDRARKGAVPRCARGVPPQSRLRRLQQRNARHAPNACQYGQRRPCGIYAEHEDARFAGLGRERRRHAAE